MASHEEAPALLTIRKRYRATRTGLLRLLTEMSDSGDGLATYYIRPGSPPPTDAPTLPVWKAKGAEAAAGQAPGLADVLREVPASETGLVVLAGHERTVVVAPPFLVREDLSFQGLEPSPLETMMAGRLLVGVVLLRLGRYAVGVLRGPELIGSKTGSRYVKRPHRAGGSSQRRFERSRERLDREMFDKACQVTRDVMEPYERSLDYVLLGGERHTLRRFVRRCPLLQGLASRTLSRLLEVHRPDRKALDTVSDEVWKSQVFIFGPGDAA